MSPKQRSKKTQAAPGSPAEAPAGKPPASRAPNTLAIAVAILGLAAMAFVLVVTGDEPARRRNIPVVSVVDRWNRSPEQNLDLVPGRDYTRGPDDAPVTIVEFSDFECPYCKDASGALDEVYERYEGDVRLVFKNYPLDQACNEYMPQPNHLYACRAAAMARCAGAQDRFWDMHDAIFELERFSTSALDALPERLGLSTEAFAECMADPSTLDPVRADVETGKRVGVQGTPTIFVNGKRAPTSSAEGLGSIVEHVLSQGS